MDSSELSFGGVIKTPSLTIKKHSPLPSATNPSSSSKSASSYPQSIASNFAI